MEVEAWRQNEVEYLDSWMWWLTCNEVLNKVVSLEVLEFKKFSSTLDFIIMEPLHPINL